MPLYYFYMSKYERVDIFNVIMNYVTIFSILLSLYKVMMISNYNHTLETLMH